MAKKDGMSDDTKTIVTVMLLAFAYPVGLIMMFVWTKWPVWVKALVTIPLAIGVLISFLIGGLIFSAVKNGDMEKEVNYNYSVTTPNEDYGSSPSEMMEP